MDIVPFSKEKAIEFLSSLDDFPIDFDEAWSWLGYSTKQKAENKLRRNFEEGLDFLTKGLKSSSGGRPGQLVVLSIDCFKSLGMMAGTSQGKRIRKYFLDCERESRIEITPTPSLPAPDLISSAIAAVFAPTSLDKNLVAGVVANAIAKQYPQLAPSMEEAKKHLPLPVEDKLLTATELAALYAKKTGELVKSAIAMNKLLEGMGLQQRNPEGKPNWLPTEQGSEFSQLVLETAKGRDKTIQSLKWYPSVINYLLEAVIAVN
ncbi:KilA-N domain family protein [Calothrix sp. NIES-4101]|nr:KilA-N domain family protein [Calothrix sp. NIES-4101]